MTLSLPKPIVMESPLRLFAKPAMISVAAVACLVVVWSLVPEREIVVEQPIVTYEVLAPVAGVVEWSAPEGATLDAGAELARIAVPSVPAEFSRLESEVARTERLLTNARREQSRVEALYRTERATRRERDDAARLTRRRQDERDTAHSALDAARAAASPPAHVVRIEATSTVRDTIALGSTVDAGDRIAELSSRSP